MIYNYLSLFERNKGYKDILFYDIFGNIVYRNPDLPTETKFFEAEYAIRSICPLRFTHTYFVSPDVYTP